WEQATRCGAGHSPRQRADVRQTHGPDDARRTRRKRTDRTGIWPAFRGCRVPAEQSRPDNVRRLRDCGEARRVVLMANRRTILYALGKWAFAALFIASGIGHFAVPDLYMKIMPPYLPGHRALVLLSGVFEIVLGVLLLVPATCRLAAWGLILLLIAV